MTIQGKLRQDGVLEKEDTSVTDVEDDEIVEVPSVPVLPKVRPRRKGTTPTPVSTQPVEVAKKVNNCSLLSIEEDKISVIHLHLFLLLYLTLKVMMMMMCLQTP